MRNWLLSHDPVAAAEALGTEAAATRTLRRPQAQRAFELWRDALTLEDRSNGWLGERAGYEAFLERTFPPEASLPTEEVVCGGVKTLRVSPPHTEDSAPLLLHLHGGGYSMGSAASSLELAGRLAGAARGVAVVAEYRLAPEHPFPAALEDIAAVYTQLRSDAPDRPLIVSGECAGGGLALSLVDVLRADGARLPDAVYVVSPFCDLSVTEAGWGFEAATDPWFDRVFATQLAAAYVQTSDPADPRVSPILLDPSGFPPLLIHAAESEAAFPGAAAIAARAQAAGVEMQLRSFPDSVHSFVLFEFLPEARTALDEFASFAAAAREGAIATEA